MASIDIQASVKEFMKERKKAFSHERGKTIGASEIGMCARNVGYRKSATPVDATYDENALGAAARGDIMEDGWSAPLLRNAVAKIGGELIWAGQDNQMSLVNADAWVSATPDGLAINVPWDCLAKYGVPQIYDVADVAASPQQQVDCIVVEFKSYDPRTNVEKLPKIQHVDQVNMQMGLIRTTEFVDANGEVTEYAPSYAMIVYTDASDYMKMQVAIVKYDHKGYLGQLSRAQHIMKAAGWTMTKNGPHFNPENVKGVELLRPEGKIGGGAECRYCAYSKRCLGYSALVPKVAQLPPKKVVAKIRELAHMLNSEKAAIEEATQKKNRIEADLKESLAEAGTKYLDTGEVKLNWKRGDGKEITDTKAMAAWIEATCKKLGKKPPDFKIKTKPTESLSVEFTEKLATA